MTFEVIKYKVATQQRRLAELVSSGISLEYETIVELDKGYRSIADALPPDLRHDYEAPIGESLAVTWKRSMVTQTIFNRMMRLHRPFMTRGYKEAKYRYSTDSALEAARMVLLTQQALNSGKFTSYFSRAQFVAKFVTIHSSTSQSWISTFTFSRCSYCFNYEYLDKL